MLPKFNKVTSPFFMPSSRYNEKRDESIKFTTNLRVNSIGEDEVSDFILEHSNVLTSENRGSKFRLMDIVEKIREDIVIHRRQGDMDWTCYVHSCFPNGWTPEQVIGKSFYDIHKPVPGFNLATSKQMVDACINKGPFERYVWGLDYDHQHRISLNYKQLKFDINNPILYVKVETQIIVGFPQVDAFVFILRQDFIPEFGIDKATLVNTLKKMTPEQRAYKSITDDVIRYLQE